MKHKTKTPPSVYKPKKTRSCPDKPIVVVEREEGVKLTKQQRRDLKRNAAAALNKEAAVRISGDSGGGRGAAPANSGRGAAPANSGRLSVYKRKPQLPPSTLPPSLQERVTKLGQRFLTPQQDGVVFAEVMKHCYDGFHVDPVSQFSAEFHARFQRSLEALSEAGCYLFDYTQPAGLNTKVTRTYVTRCLVGIPGITYKYLGLRMFSYPWTPGETGCTSEMVEIGRLSDALSERTGQILQASQKQQHGSHRYNLTLINKCFADDGKSSEVVLKPEPLYGTDRITVSWHADSSLQHYSSIAVYHFTKPMAEEEGGEQGKQGKQQDLSWRIALKVSPNAEGPHTAKRTLADDGDQDNDASAALPAVAIPLPTGHTYYLLDDFNHHHQHSVLSGQSERYASTHRVSREDGHTFQYIRKHCLAVLNEGGGACFKAVRAQQLCLTELEFEWIRQYWIQGRRHHDLHTWWHAPMSELVSLWSQLECLTFKSIQTLLDAVSAELRAGVTSLDEGGLETRKERKRLLKRQRAAETVDSSSYAEMAGHLEDRIAKREGWASREKDAIFKNASPDLVPLPPPLSPAGHPLSLDLLPSSTASLKNLKSLVARLRAAGKEFNDHIFANTS